MNIFCPYVMSMYKNKYKIKECYCKNLGRNNSEDIFLKIKILT